MTKKKTNIAISDEVVIDKIFIVREKKVMIDTDLAELYGVPTKRLNEQVKRNMKRFPEDFVIPTEPRRETSLNRKLHTFKQTEILTEPSICIYRTWSGDVGKCTQQ